MAKGDENVPENAPSQKFLDPSKRDSFWSVKSWLFVQEKQSTDIGAGVKNVPDEGPPP